MNNSLKHMAQEQSLPARNSEPPRDGKDIEHQVALDTKLAGDIQGQKGGERDTRSAA